MDRVQIVLKLRPVHVDTRVAEGFVLRSVDQANLRKVSVGCYFDVDLPVEFVILDPICVKGEIVDVLPGLLQDVVLNRLFYKLVLFLLCLEFHEIFKLKVGSSESPFHEDLILLDLLLHKVTNKE